MRLSSPISAPLNTSPPVAEVFPAGTTNRPGLAVQIAFVTPRTVNPQVWTDVTADTENVDWHRGRQYERDVNEVGTLNAALLNKTGNYTPGNTASPNYPGVRLARRCRVVAQYAGVTYRRFFGGVERYPQSWRIRGKYAMTPLVAVDDQAVLALATYGSRYLDLVPGTSASGRFDGTSGAETNPATTPSTWSGGNIVYQPPVIAGYAKSWEIASAPATGDVGATNVATLGIGAIVAAPQSIPTDGSFFTINGAVAGGATVANGLRYQFGATSTAARYAIAMNQAGSPNVVDVFPCSAAVIPTAGRADLIVVRSVGGNVVVTINGTVVLTTTLTGYSSPLGGGSTLCKSAAGHRTTPTSFKVRLNGYTDNTSTLSQAQENDLYDAVLHAREYPAQTVSQRLNAIADTFLISSDNRAFEVSNLALAATGSLAGTTPLTLLQEIAECELGDVFFNGAGQLVFQNRTHRVLGTIPVTATFGENTGEIPYEDGVAFDYDPNQIINQARITITGGTMPVGVSDDYASQAEYGVHPYTKTLPFANATDAQTAADLLVARLAQPLNRVKTLTVEAINKPVNFPTLLGLDKGAIVVVNRRDSLQTDQTGTYSIEKLGDTVVTTKSWVFTFEAAPVFAA